MKAVRLHSYHEAPRLDDVPEPRITGPHDVIVRVAGAGLCRTDGHIRDGWFAPAVATIPHAPQLRPGGQRPLCPYPPGRFPYRGDAMRLSRLLPALPAVLFAFADLIDPTIWWRDQLLKTPFYPVEVAPAT